jgi:hypothetical protein
MMKSVPIQAPAPGRASSVAIERDVTRRGGVAGECLAHLDGWRRARTRPRARRRATPNRPSEDSPGVVTTPSVSVITVMTADVVSWNRQRVAIERDARDCRHDEQRDRRERDPSREAT